MDVWRASLRQVGVRISRDRCRANTYSHKKYQSHSSIRAGFARFTVLFLAVSSPSCAERSRCYCPGECLVLNRVSDGFTAHQRQGEWYDEKTSDASFLYGFHNFFM